MINDKSRDPLTPGGPQDMGESKSHNESGIPCPFCGRVECDGVKCSAKRIDRLTCMDCPAVYSEFSLDMTIPDEQWLQIHSGEGGVLCASCMVKRLSKLPGAIAVRAYLEQVSSAPVVAAREETADRAALLPADQPASPTTTEALPNTASGHMDLSHTPPDTFISFAQMGNCRVCGQHEDLRMGACFSCADQVDGKPIAGGHELWDTRNPANRWTVREQ